MASSSSEQISEQIGKYLTSLNGTEDLMNNILHYCQQLYKKNPNKESISQIQSYLFDNVNTVGEHIYAISKKIDSLFDAQIDELDGLKAEMSQINHRLTSAEGFVSNAFMLKFRGLHRRNMPLNVKSQTVADERLPRANKERKPWKRKYNIDYSILDSIGPVRRAGEGRGGHRVSTILDPDLHDREPGQGKPEPRPSYINYSQPGQQRASLRQANENGQNFSQPPAMLSGGSNNFKKPVAEQQKPVSAPAQYEQPAAPVAPAAPVSAPVFQPDPPVVMPSEGPGGPGSAPPPPVQNNSGPPKMPAPPGGEGGPPKHPGSFSPPMPPPSMGMGAPPKPPVMGGPPKPPAAPVFGGPPAPPGGGPPAPPGGPPAPPPPSGAPAGFNASDPKWSGYKKMIKIKMPHQSIRNKMRQNGDDPTLLELLL